MKTFPLTLDQKLEHMARETARLAYPGRMSGGKKPIVKRETKKRVEDYFATEFRLARVWQRPTEIARQYDTWHRARCRELGRVISSQLATPGNDAEVVAAKFLDLYMHQLMRYERFRPLWLHLHLPLDRRVVARLRPGQCPPLRVVAALLANSPYHLQYRDYARIQEVLWGVIRYLNRRPGVAFRVRSRIELNWLWV